MRIIRKNKHFIWVESKEKLRGINFKIVEDGIYRIPITPRNLFELGEQFPDIKKFKEFQIREEKYLASIKEKTWGLIIKNLINDEKKIAELKEKLESKIELTGEFFKHQILSIYFGTIFPSVGLFLKMGLGKTYCATHIMKFRMYHSGVRRTWIITPKSLISQCVDELIQFFPELKGKVIPINNIQKIKTVD